MQFTIEKDGTITGITTVKPSQSIQLNGASMRALKQLHLAALPPAFA